MSIEKTPILIAGIGGASLGTEILKCLKGSPDFCLFGCDISEYAFGHYQEGFNQTFLIDQDCYVESILKICDLHGIRAVIPGGEEPLRFLCSRSGDFDKLGIIIAANAVDVIHTCSNKKSLFEFLKKNMIPVPRTTSLANVDELDGLENFPFPCVIKPSEGTGGSRFVFLAKDREEARVHLSLLLRDRDFALLQEYISLDEGEFTIGVLSLPGGAVYGSIAMKRLFNAKLSIQMSSSIGIISSGYSQGLIDVFPGLCAQAENIAKLLNSVGPINVQARVRNGVLMPFEINPRFSASTYLRTLAGFNEVEVYLKFALHGVTLKKHTVDPMYCLRSLDQVLVRKETLKK